MKSKSTIRTTFIVAGVACLAGTGMLSASLAWQGSIFNPTADQFIDQAGNFKMKLLDYRGTWENMGVWSVDSDEDGTLNEAHFVFASPGTSEAYQATGKFPDGTVLVKELRDVETSSLKTGKAATAEGVKGYFVMIKDTQKRFPDNGNWVNGWGWAYFEPDDLEFDVMPTSKCIECHEPAEDTDWVYIDYYKAFNRGQ